MAIKDLFRVQKALRSLETGLSGLDDVYFPVENENLNNKDNISGWLAEQVPERIMRIATVLDTKFQLKKFLTLLAGINGF